MGNKTGRLVSGDHVFTELEVTLLVKMYQNLAANSPGKTIDKTMFLKFFPLPGLFGERLFNLFDTKRTNEIDYEEFISGCSRVCGGTAEGKMNFFFQLYDLNDDKCITRVELEAILRHVPMDVLNVPHESEHLDVADKLQAICDLEFPESDSVMDYPNFEGFLNRQQGMREYVLKFFKPFHQAILSLDQTEHRPPTTPRRMPSRSFTELYDEGPRTGTGNPKIQRVRTSSFLRHGSSANADSATISHVRTRSSSTCSTGSASAGARFVTCDECFVQIRYCAECGSEYVGVAEMASPPSSRRSTSLPPPKPSNADVVDDANRSAPSSPAFSAIPIASPHSSSMEVVSGVKWSRMCNQCGAEGQWAFCSACRAPFSAVSLREAEYEEGDTQQAALEQSGTLYKREAKTQRFVMRRYFLRDKMLTYYKENSSTPSGVTFLPGCYVRKTENPEVEKRGFFGFELTPRFVESGSKRLYASSPEDREEWVQALLRASESRDVRDYYRICEELGQGRWSKVYRCERIRPGVYSGSFFCPPVHNCGSRSIHILHVVRP